MRDLRDTQVVDARILCVQYLRRAGMSCKKSKGYRKMFCNYTLRCLDSKIFRILSTNINSELSDILASN